MDAGAAYTADNPVPSSFLSAGIQPPFMLGAVVLSVGIVIEERALGIHPPLFRLFCTTDIWQAYLNGRQLICSYLCFGGGD